MKKTIISTIMIALATSASAGGFLTNTNQSIQFLRNPARQASIGVDGVYYNHAGMAFMDEGFHLSFNWQRVHQHRDTWSGYDKLFAANFDNPTTAETDFRRKFKGRVNVPIQPSLFLAYNKNTWSFQFGFGFIGGGGECEFKEGLGSFEALVGSMGMKTLGKSFGGYSLESYLDGRSYDLGFTLTAAKRLTDHLSVSVGARAIYATNNYSGYLTNIKYRMITPEGAQIIESPNSYELDCAQSGVGVAPIIGIDYKPNRYVNFAAKYEFKTRLRVESESDNNEAFDNLAQSQPAFAGYLDGAKTACDMPGLLTLGAQVTPIDQLRLSAGYHHYFDVDTKQWNRNVLGDTNEFMVGAEYDICKAVDISAGYQKTIYDQKADNLSDASFCLDSYSFGFGVGVDVSPIVKLHAAYFQTNYKDYNKTTSAPSSITFSRTNTVIGVGVEVNF